MKAHHGDAWREKRLLPGVHATEVGQMKPELATPNFSVETATTHADSDPVRERTAKEVHPTPGLTELPPTTPTGYIHLETFSTYSGFHCLNKSFRESIRLR
jgi:hypothetical protein